MNKATKLSPAKEKALTGLLQEGAYIQNDLYRYRLYVWKPRLGLTNKVIHKGTVWALIQDGLIAAESGDNKTYFLTDAGREALK